MSTPRLRLDSHDHGHELPVAHRAIGEGKCRCGKSFDDDLALDTHILGPELAMKAHRDRMEALKVIHPHVACVHGCYEPNYDFDCPVHGGMRGAE